MALFGALNLISNVRVSSDVHVILHDIAERYELATVAYLATGIRQIGDREPYLAVTYSSDWVEHYREKQYVKIDPVVQVGVRRLLPFDGDELDIKGETPRKFFDEAREFGLGQRGATIPVHGRFGDRALLSVTCNHDEKEWANKRPALMRDFQVLATHFHDMILRIEGSETQSPRLSPRERECLLWAAEGKTAWECAVILGLSEQTVRCYLESARHKLGATSTTHAVAKAIKANLLLTIP